MPLGGAVGLEIMTAGASPAGSPRPRFAWSEDFIKDERMLGTLVYFLSLSIKLFQRNMYTDVPEGLPRTTRDP